MNGESREGVFREIDSSLSVSEPDAESFDKLLVGMMGAVNAGKSSIVRWLLHENEKASFVKPTKKEKVLLWKRGEGPNQHEDIFLMDVSGVFKAASDDESGDVMARREVNTFSLLKTRMILVVFVVRVDSSSFEPRREDQSLLKKIVHGYLGGSLKQILIVFNSSLEFPPKDWEARMHRATKQLLHNVTFQDGFEISTRAIPIFLNQVFDPAISSQHRVELLKRLERNEWTMQFQERLLHSIKIHAEEARAVRSQRMKQVVPKLSFVERLSGVFDSNQPKTIVEAVQSKSIRVLKRFCNEKQGLGISELETGLFTAATIGTTTQLEFLVEICEKSGLEFVDWQFFKDVVRERQKRNVESPARSVAFVILGDIHVEYSQFEKALNTYQTALQIRRNSQGDRHLDVASVLYKIGSTYEKQGSIETALQFYKKGLNISQERLGNGHPDVATAINDIAEVLRQEDESVGVL